MTDAMYYEVGDSAADGAERNDAMYYEVGGSVSDSLLADPDAAFEAVLG